MTTEIKHIASNPDTRRVFTATEEQWEKHEDLIVHWVEGGCVEYRGDDPDWSTADDPAFVCQLEYRKAQRKPKAGEVWRMRSTDLHFLFSDGKFVCISQDKGDPGELPLGSWEYIAPSLEAYFAREFLSEVADGVLPILDEDYRDLLKEKASL